MFQGVLYTLDKLPIEAGVLHVKDITRCMKFGVIESHFFLVAT